jgi:hypothetical protein
MSQTSHIDALHDEPAQDDLVGFVASVSGGSQLKVEENLGEGFVRLRVGEAERRQAKHDIQSVEDAVVEMLRNARDAGAHHIYVATGREGDARYLTMIDDGVGIPDDMQDRIFDARVTSKLETVHMDRWGVHGRGMALFSISENVSSARVVTSAPGLGSSLRVDVDCSLLPERADQSTWPHVGVDDDGVAGVSRGPHNIIRTCCEFALEERSTCEVYLGSASEILSTLRARSDGSTPTCDLLFVDDVTTIPVVSRPSVAADADELMRIASGIGLDLSERTAHRILSGQIKPTRSVLARLQHVSGGQTREVDLTKDCRGLHIADQDAQGFSRLLERDFSYLADRYYLQLSGEPHVRATGNRITVTFDVDKRD